MKKGIVVAGLLLASLISVLDALELRPAENHLKGGSDEHVTFTGSCENKFQMEGYAESGWRILNAHMDKPSTC